MTTLTEKQQNLVSYYEARLEKVKKQWPIDSEYILKERSEEYIKYAENELEKVKNGRTW